jgi:arsenate reductase
LGLNDPTGQTDDEFIKVIKQIEKNILALKNQLKQSPR